MSLQSCPPAEFMEDVLRVFGVRGIAVNGSKNMSQITNNVTSSPEFVFLALMLRIRTSTHRHSQDPFNPNVYIDCLSKLAELRGGDKCTRGSTRGGQLNIIVSDQMKELIWHLGLRVGGSSRMRTRSLNYLLGQDRSLNPTPLRGSQFGDPTGFDLLDDFTGSVGKFAIRALSPDPCLAWKLCVSSTLVKPIPPVVHVHPFSKDYEMAGPLVRIRFEARRDTNVDWGQAVASLATRLVRCGIAVSPEFALKMHANYDKNTNTILFPSFLWTLIVIRTMKPPTHCKVWLLVCSLWMETLPALRKKYTVFEAGRHHWNSPHWTCSEERSNTICDLCCAMRSICTLFPSQPFSWSGHSNSMLRFMDCVWTSSPNSACMRELLCETDVISKRSDGTSFENEETRLLSYAIASVIWSKSRENAALYHDQTDARDRWVSGRVWASDWGLPRVKSGEILTQKTIIDSIERSKQLGIERGVIGFPGSRMRPPPAVRWFDHLASMVINPNLKPTLRIFVLFAGAPITQGACGEKSIDMCMSFAKCEMCRWVGLAKMVLFDEGFGLTKTACEDEQLAACVNSPPSHRSERYHEAVTRCVFNYLLRGLVHHALEDKDSAWGLCDKDIAMEIDNPHQLRAVVVSILSEASTVGASFDPVFADATQELSAPGDEPHYYELEFVRSMLWYLDNSKLDIYDMLPNLRQIDPTYARNNNTPPECIIIQCAATNNPYSAHASAFFSAWRV